MNSKLTLFTKIFAEIKENPKSDIIVSWRPKTWLPNIWPNIRDGKIKIKQGETGEWMFNNKIHSKLEKSETKSIWVRVIYQRDKTIKEISGVKYIMEKVTQKKDLNFLCKEINSVSNSQMNNIWEVKNICQFEKPIIFEQYKHWKTGKIFNPRHSGVFVSSYLDVKSDIFNGKFW